MFVIWGFWVFCLSFVRGQEVQEAFCGVAWREKDV